MKSGAWYRAARRLTTVRGHCNRSLSRRTDGRPLTSISLMIMSSHEGAEALRAQPFHLARQSGPACRASPALRAGKLSGKSSHSVVESLEAEIASEAGHTLAEHTHDWVVRATRNVRFREQA
jgi:hypothetical protein